MGLAAEGTVGMSMRSRATEARDRGGTVKMRRQDPDWKKAEKKTFLANSWLFWKLDRTLSFDLASLAALNNSVTISSQIWSDDARRK
jgi:hypothetical protein